jgi:hypothetical protein
MKMAASEFGKWLLGRHSYGAGSSRGATLIWSQAALSIRTYEKTFYNAGH